MNNLNYLKNSDHKQLTSYDRKYESNENLGTIRMAVNSSQKCTDSLGEHIILNPGGMK